MNKKLLAVIFGAGLMLAACGGGNNKAKIITLRQTPATTTTETASVDAEKIVNSKCISLSRSKFRRTRELPSS